MRASALAGETGEKKQKAHTTCTNCLFMFIYICFRLTHHMPSHSSPRRRPGRPSFPSIPTRPRPPPPGQTLLQHPPKIPLGVFQRQIRLRPHQLPSRRALPKRHSPPRQALPEVDDVAARALDVVIKRHGQRRVVHQHQLARGALLQVLAPPGPVVADSEGRARRGLLLPDEGVHLLWRVRARV